MPRIMNNIKEISKIEGLEDFSGYFVDTAGNVYSNKRTKQGLKKMATFNRGFGPNYRKVFLHGKSGAKKAFYVHVLVGKLFIPKSNHRRYFIHRSTNVEDNSLENIITVDKYRLKKDHRMGRPRTRKELINDLEKESILSDKLVAELKLFYKAAIIKGCYQGKEFDFVEEMVTEMLEMYASQRGLKKILHQIRQEEGQVV